MTEEAQGGQSNQTIQTTQQIQESPREFINIDTAENSRLNKGGQSENIYETKIVKKDK
ncbi:MAG: hypothetical protein ABI594_15905 [Ginsengibacter sp.]